MAGPPASMRGAGASSTPKGNRSPPNYRGSVDQAPGAMRGYQPNTGMAASRVASPPRSMATPKDNMEQDPHRVAPPQIYATRKLPNRYPSGS